MWQLYSWCSFWCEFISIIITIFPYYADLFIMLLFLSYPVQLDCFHPSVIGNQNMAKALWNNMLTPAAQKKTSFDSSEDIVCPTNSTLLYTN